MKINDVINQIKAYYKGGFDEENTRDKVLYGNSKKECTGIMITLWANGEVIKEAIKKGANLIICHEALFWNHGDHIDWLKQQNNQTFYEKQQLLDETGIVVWRNHDYIHSGIPILDNYQDGIFYGFAKKMKWEQYADGQYGMPMYFNIPKTSANEIANQMCSKLNLNGLRMIGRGDMMVEKIFLCMHIWGIEEDNELIKEIDQGDYDLILPGETVDFTVNQYVYDSAVLLQNKAMIIPGHFNIEEPGMEYMMEYLPSILNENIPCYFISSKDMYQYYKN